MSSAHATALIVIVPIRHPIFEFSYDLSRSSMYNNYICWTYNHQHGKLLIIYIMTQELALSGSNKYQTHLIANRG
jgi:hypothetical protein